MCDPALTCQARVVFAMLYEPLHIHGALQISRDEIAQKLGYAMRETTRALAELDAADLLYARLGGRGKGKVFYLGAGVVGGSDRYAITVSSPSRNPSQLNAIIVSSTSDDEPQGSESSPDDWPPAARQLPLVSSDLDPSSQADLVVSYISSDEPRAREADAAQSNAGESAGARKIRGLLRHNGLTPAQIARCLERCGLERIYAQIAALDLRIADIERKGESVRNKPALLLSSILADWPLPPAREAEAQSFVQRQLQRAEKTLNSIEDPVVAERRKQIANLRAYIAAVPENVRDQWESDAYRWVKVNIPRAVLHQRHHHEELRLFQIAREHAQQNGVQL
jgi:hypothetical protein